MKIFLMAYARKNFGDDLFVKMLLERYPRHDFYMKVDKYEYLDLLDKHENLHVLIGPDTDEELYNSDVNDYDGYIYIGGSIFMEGGKVYNLSEKFYDFVKRCKEAGKPFCYISCNYGPYQTKEYLELSKKNFKTCTDICFRDKYSYDMFKDIENVRYAPDYAFTYKISNNEKIKNSIGISIIDLSIRENLKDKQESYIRMLTNNISEYLNQGKKVYLYSFCEPEGDERTMDILLEEFKGNPNIIGVRFDGDVDKFLDIYIKMEYMICARFHAVILSSVARQKMYVMSYSKKIDNVINDLRLDLPIIHFDEISSNLSINLSEFNSIEENKIKRVINEAENQELAVKKF